MGKDYILVIDEGTTGTRAILFDKKFQIAEQSYEEFCQHTPAENMVEHDAEEIYDLSVKMCKNVIEKKGISAENIIGIGITNQRNTAVIWDKHTGKPLHHALVWQDSRMGKMCEDIKATPFFEEILNTTGKVIGPHTNVLFLKWYLDNIPGIKEKIEKGDVLFGTIDTWLVWKLTGGKVHATSFSNASSTGCMDVEKQEWYQKLFDYVGVPVSVFPSIQSESSDYGETTIFGGSIPIRGVIADQQSALFAGACIDAGTVKCTNGTGSFLDINVGSKFQTSPGGVDTIIAWNLDGKCTYAVEGFAPVTGSAVQWLRDGLKIIESAKDIEKLASSVPDTNGVYFIPALSGLMAPHQDPFARGMMIGITRGTTDAHIARATLEAIAFSIKDILNIVEENGVKIKEIKIDGGASKNNLLAQTLADYCDAEIMRPESLEATALGAAYMVALYANLISSEDVKGLVKIESEFKPEIKKEKMKEHYEYWKDAVERSKKWIKA